MAAYPTHRGLGLPRPPRTRNDHLTSGDQPAASAPSEENTRPIVMAPVVSAFFVCGPPASSDENVPALRLYVVSRPGWQNGRCGHSGGPPRTVAVPEHFSANSVRVFTPFLSANALVTANAFWSAAFDALPTVSPALSARPFSPVTVFSISPVAIGAAD